MLCKFDMAERNILLISCPYSCLIHPILSIFFFISNNFCMISDLCCHISVLNFSSELRAQQSEATPQPITVSSVLTTRPLPIRHKRIGTSRLAGGTAVSRIWAGRILHWAGSAYTWHWRLDIVLYKRSKRNENMSPCNGNRLNTVY